MFIASMAAIYYLTDLLWPPIFIITEPSKLLMWSSGENKKQPRLVITPIQPPLHFCSILFITPALDKVLPDQRTPPLYLCSFPPASPALGHKSRSFRASATSFSILHRPTRIPCP